MLERFGIEDWDMVLIGDGSGCKWDHEMGWAVTAIEKDSMERRVFWGAANKGTVNFAEMMAYLQPLLWYFAELDQREKKSKTRNRVRQVHIITDSEYVRTRGDQENRMFKRNRLLWQIFDLIQRFGYILHWHWAERDTVALNTFADQLSKAARILVKESNTLKEVDDRIGVYDCNPWS